MEVVEKKYVGAIDQGTTGTRFILFTRDGQIVRKSYLEHEQIYPNPGWVEHDPVEIWENTKKVMKNTLDNKIKPEEIAAIGVTNQRETTMIWDPKTGNPLHNAIVWQDTRTKEICENIKQTNLGELIQEKTGLFSHTYFSGTKIKWLLDNIKTARKKAENGRAIFGNMDTWIIWNLTGGPQNGAHVTDYTNASRTMLMNLETLDWDKEILQELDIPKKILPEIKPSSDKQTYGTVEKGPKGLNAPVCGDLGDQQAALFGQTCFEPGEVKNTYGTGCFALVNTGENLIRSDNGLLTTPAYGLEKGNCVYALEGSVPVAGAAIQWLRDNLRIIDSAKETEELAKSVDNNGGVYFVPAFSGLFAPRWDMSARGTIVGLTGSIRKEHVVRAVLEAICYQTKDMLEAVKSNFDVSFESLKVDGGVTANDFLLQLQANILGSKIIRPTIKETTALGASYAAGLAVGFWHDLESIRKNWAPEKVFEPEWSADKRETEYEGWEKAIEKSRGWIE